MQNRKQTRLGIYDYSTPGYYFITCCVEHRNNYLGTIVDGQMTLNQYGTIVTSCWLDLPNHYANCTLDVFVVMPNHFHGIIIITQERNGYKPFPTRTHGLSEMIRGFKTFSSKKINSLGTLSFSWQKSFYDHVVRKDESLDKIREYIRNNPKQWELDEENPINITDGL